MEYKNLTDMSYMFSGLKSLKSIPKISKWNTKNVKYTHNMFYGCSSLNPFPDLSKWKTEILLV